MKKPTSVFSSLLLLISLFTCLYASDKKPKVESLEFQGQVFHQAGVELKGNLVSRLNESPEFQHSDAAAKVRLITKSFRDQRSAVRNQKAVKLERRSAEKKQPEATPSLKGKER